MAEIKDSAEKDDRISLTEIASISTLLFAAFGAIIYASGVYCWNRYLEEMKLSSHHFPTSVNDVNIVVGGLFSLVVILGLALIPALIFILLYNISIYRKKSVVDKAFVGAPLIFAFIIIVTIASFEILGNNSRKAAQETLKEINNSTTRLPKLALVLEDGQIYCPPGVRIICSERFCGLNDGKNSTVVSLERVRSIQTELPAECPTAPPGSEAKSAAALFF